MIIGVSSQVDLYHISAILFTGSPTLVGGGAAPQISVYDDQYRFVVLSERSPNTQIQQCLSILPDTERIVLIGNNWEGNELPETTLVAANVDEMEEYMVLSMSVQQKSKIANRIFGQFSFRDHVQLGFAVLQGVTGYTGTLEEFIGPPPDREIQLVPRVEIIDDSPPIRVKRIIGETCVICQEKPATIMLDCGHTHTCDNCTEQWVEQTSGKCPICNHRVKRIFVDDGMGSK